MTGTIVGQIVQRAMGEREEHIASLFENSVFADFKIVVQDHTFNVHRVIIAQGSSFLSKLFSGNFEEATTGTLVIRDHSVETVRALLEYLYKSDYSDKNFPSAEEPSGSCILYHIEVYVLADQYAMEHLAGLAAYKFEEAAEALFTQHRSWDVSSAIQMAYSGTGSSDKMLRPLVVKLALKHWEELFGSLGSEEVLVTTPELCADMLIAKMSPGGLKLKLKQESIKVHNLRGVPKSINYNLRAVSRASLKRKPNELA